uniref:Uncharacterized protein n=1 Tax=Mycena chlorophos TaxID=658473 RepID=A0ABQ0L9U7_MYCCL|nr:predicted protein [Mycena chlorophos]
MLCPFPDEIGTIAEIRTGLRICVVGDPANELLRVLAIPSPELRACPDDRVAKAADRAISEHEGLLVFRSRHPGGSQGATIPPTQKQNRNISNGSALTKMGSKAANRWQFRASCPRIPLPRHVPVASFREPGTATLNDMDLTLGETRAVNNNEAPGQTSSQWRRYVRVDPAWGSGRSTCNVNPMPVSRVRILPAVVKIGYVDGVASRSCRTPSRRMPVRSGNPVTRLAVASCMR